MTGNEGKKKAPGPVRKAALVLAWCGGRASEPPGKWASMEGFVSSVSRLAGRLPSSPDEILCWVEYRPWEDRFIYRQADFYARPWPFGARVEHREHPTKKEAVEDAVAIIEGIRKRMSDCGMETWHEGPSEEDLRMVENARPPQEKTFPVAKKRHGGAGERNAMAPLLLEDILGE